MAKANWFTFNSFEEHKICQKSNQEYSTQGFNLKTRNLYQGFNEENY